MSLLPIALMCTLCTVNEVERLQFKPEEESKIIILNGLHCWEYEQKGYEKALFCSTIEDILKKMRNEEDDSN